MIRAEIVAIYQDVSYKMGIYVLCLKNPKETGTEFTLSCYVKCFHGLLSAFSLSWVSQHMQPCLTSLSRCMPIKLKWDAFLQAEKISMHSLFEMACVFP